MLPQQGNGSIQFVLSNAVGARQNNAGGSLYLIVVELTEVLHIEFDLFRVGDSDEATELYILAFHLPGGSDDVRQLTNAGRLDEDAFGVVFRDQLPQGITEITNQGTADATGVHLGNLDAGFAQEAAVDTNLAEFVLDESQLLAGECLRDHFLDKGGLAGTQKTRIDIDNSQR